MLRDAAIYVPAPIAATLRNDDRQTQCDVMFDIRRAAGGTVCRIRSPGEVSWFAVQTLALGSGERIETISILTILGAKFRRNTNYLPLKARIPLKLE